MIGSLLNALLPGLTSAINASYPAVAHGANLLVEALTALLGNVLGTL